MEPIQTKLLIGGEWLSGDATIDVVNPATEQLVASVAAGGPKTAQVAVAAANSAQPGWAAQAPRGRAELLRACWQTLIDHIEELAALITAENGKPLADARSEVGYAAEFFRWNAEEAVRLHGTLGVAPDGDKRVLVHHIPVGVVVMVTPWNFPAAMITRKLAPALAAGNAVVVKPPEQAPLTALRIAELLTDAGLPPGLVNVVPTTDAVGWFDAAIAAAPTRMVSFTGSTETGRALLRKCADRVLKTVMELGGNAPFIVFDDADLDLAITSAMQAKMRHSAETCTAANRFFVQSGVAAEFTDRLVAAMGDVVIGDGTHDGVTCGPLITSDDVTRIDALVRGAVDDGARLALGGRRPDRPGWFYEPTVLAEVDASAPITTSEIFGPVAPVIPFPDTEAVIAAANNTEAGLTAYVHTGDLARGLAVSERLQYGMVGLNRGLVSEPAAPFGGMKQSGLGREGGFDGIHEFTETQYIATNW